MKALRAIAHNLRIEAHMVWLAARDPQVPLAARIFGLLIAAYALSPIDLIPDFIPILGLLDEAILIPIAVWLFLKMIPKDIHARHRAEAEAASERPVSRAGAVAIGLIWAAGLAWAAVLFWGSGIL